MQVTALRVMRSQHHFNLFLSRAILCLLAFQSSSATSNQSAMFSSLSPTYYPSFVSPSVLFTPNYPLFSLSCDSLPPSLSSFPPSHSNYFPFLLFLAFLPFLAFPLFFPHILLFLCPFLIISLSFLLFPLSSPLHPLFSLSSFFLSLYFFPYSHPHFIFPSHPPYIPCFLAILYLLSPVPSYPLLSFLCSFPFIPFLHFCNYSLPHHSLSASPSFSFPPV